MQLIGYVYAVTVVLSVIAAWVWKLRLSNVRPFLGLTVTSGVQLFSVYYFFAIRQGLFDGFVIFAMAQMSSRTLQVIFNRVELNQRQWKDDDIANIALDDNLSIPFALYLRPFEVTDRLGLQGISSKWGGADIEVLLAEACRSWGTLIALGKKEGGSIGAGRLRRDDESWRSTFHKLAKKARLIILIPASSEGTFFEIEWIKDNKLLEKTIFVMPPKTVVRMWESAQSPLDTKDYAVSWSLLQQRSKDIGFRFPAYDSKGGLVEFKNDGSLYAQWAFEDDSYSQVRSILKVLRAHLLPR